MGDVFWWALVWLVVLLLLIFLVTACFKIGVDFWRLRKGANSPSPQQQNFWGYTIAATVGGVGLVLTLIELFERIAANTIVPVTATAIVVTSTPVAVPPVTPTPQIVGLSPLRRHYDGSESFSLMVPEAWVAIRVPEEREVAVQFLPSEDIRRFDTFISVNTLLIRVVQSDEKLKQRIKEVVEAQFMSLDPNIEGEPKIAEDGSVSLAWYYTLGNEDTSEVRVRAISWIWQTNGQLAVLTVAVPDAQYDELFKTIMDIRQSCRITTPAP